MIILLLGPHGAGKTTLGTALARERGWIFHEEIGRGLAEDPRFRPASIGAADRQVAFDREVFAREVERDLAFSDTQRGEVRIVETWHPGNFAYAWTRSPEIAMAMVPYLRDRIDWSKVVVVPVVANTGTLESRRTCPASTEFFHHVSCIAVATTMAFRAQILPPVVTDSTPPAELATRLATRLDVLSLLVSRRRCTTSRPLPM